MSNYTTKYNPWSKALQWVAEITEVAWSSLTGVPVPIQNTTEAFTTALKTKLDNINNPMLFKGGISVASDFPTLAEVQNGWTYKIDSDVTDNDVTKTNTNQSFLELAEISWNGTNWTELGYSQVKSVNSKTGIVELDASDVGAEEEGVASSLIGNHESTYNHANLHVQNSDTKLDEGGADEISASELQDILKIYQDIIMDNTMTIAELDASINLEMINGFKDAYEDTSGVDTVNSINLVYNEYFTRFQPVGDYPSAIKLYIPFDGEDDATSAEDLSPSEHVLTFNGNAKLDTSTKKFGTACLELDGSGDYISIPDSADWDIWASTEDNWTIDFWVRHNVTNTTQVYFSQEVANENKFQLRLQPDGSIISFFIVTGSYGHYAQTPVSTISPNTWYHIALIKVGTYTGIYVNGIQKAYHLMPFTATWSAPVKIGESLNGRIDEYRVQKQNFFNALPVVGLTDTIDVPEGEYSPNVENMTMISEVFAMPSVPSSSRLLFKIEEAPDNEIILNTDLMFYLSRDGDSNRVQGTPELVKQIGNDLLVGVDFDLSSLPSGQNLVYRVVSANNKNFYINSVACQIK